MPASIYIINKDRINDTRYPKYTFKISLYNIHTSSNVIRFHSSLSAFFYLNNPMALCEHLDVVHFHARVLQGPAHGGEGGPDTSTFQPWRTKAS